MQQTVDGNALCGFSRCRNPLPPPGPRGGRPYEFCPERTWPGNVTCKQLAAAENALRAALGVESGTAALGGVATEVREHIDRVLGPAEALKAVLEQVVTRLDGEVTTALAAVDAAEKAAALDRGLREHAEGQAAEAERAAREAHALTAEHGAARAAAEHSRDEALARMKAAELKQARAESRRDAEHERAEHAEHRARDAAHREHQATEAAAVARQETASLRAELAGLEQRLVDERSSGARALERAEADLTAARADLAGTRREAAHAAERHNAEAAQAADKHRAELDRTLDRAETRLAAATDAHQATQAKLHQELGAAKHRAERAEAEVTTLRLSTQALNDDLEHLRRVVGPDLPG
ncbi:Exonuclease SbcC [Alloactinosynnema sp. L-07]|uniref:hypothetical protein n=1 Tax=Alloactinosynnema sp. L-07 TaxID=1653480 RepID=UPI00065F04C0|nr:hypothetical protein [Alloactinosynnema sp. L-07]CRK57146.1 Exonuclease SbcC [Alloactinosynnema sp. L-07]